MSLKYYRSNSTTQGASCCGTLVLALISDRYGKPFFCFAVGGAAIPLGARIFAIIDVFDALTSKRPYKEPLPFFNAIAVLERVRGTHFDPKLLDVFERIAVETHAQVGAYDDSALRRTVRSQVAEHFRLADEAAG